jgi:hypothetical protein
MIDIFQSTSRRNKELFDQGYKKGLVDGAKSNGSGFIGLIVILVIGYGLYTYAQKNTTQPKQAQAQVIDTKFTSESELKPIPAADINIVNDQSINVNLGSKELDSNISIDITPSATVKRGIFQPKK